MNLEAQEKLKSEIHSYLTPSVVNQIKFASVIEAVNLEMNGEQNVSPEAVFKKNLKSEIYKYLDSKGEVK